MIKLLLLLFVLVSACVAIHGAGMVFGLRWLTRIWSRQGHHFSRWTMFRILVSVVYGLLLLHVVQIILWAAFYQWSGCFPDFNTSFYYSATSYATVGYGDVIPPGEWRILGSVQGVTGILMFGWSTGALFSVANHLIKLFGGDPPAGPQAE
jgi:voltage-gated potassium channel